MKTLQCDSYLYFETKTRCTWTDLFGQLKTAEKLVDVPNVKLQMKKDGQHVVLGSNEYMDSNERNRFHDTSRIERVTLYPPV